MIALFHHYLRALLSHPDDGGVAGWKVIDNGGCFALIRSRADELAIDGIDVDAAGGRCVVEGFDGLTIPGDDVLEVLPGLCSLICLDGSSGDVESCVFDRRVSESIIAG